MSKVTLALIGRCVVVCVLLLIIAFLTGCSSTPQREANQASVGVVENYLSALNRRDLLALTAYVTPDVEWYSMVGDERVQEVNGREALADSLRQYFAQTERAHWVMEAVLAFSNVIAVRERSEWRDANDHGSRVTLCTYEIRDGRIRRITQFLTGR